MYGGTRRRWARRSRSRGLSPRVRGNLLVALKAVYDRRSIPACTGEPQYGNNILQAMKVYPRVYGGTVPMSVQTVLPKGLSPRVRGNLRWRASKTWPLRSIPACTGEPRHPRLRDISQRVYPRVYGGTFRGTPGTMESTGLSPRVRGNLPPSVPIWVYQRSIPACTGEPLGPAVNPQVVQVYPRVYGGTQKKAAVQGFVKGLSPRVRGNHHRRRTPEPPLRSIPACTGEPPPVQYGVVPIKVYPRVYGGTCQATPIMADRAGLSPRVRGNHPEYHD